MPTLPLLTLSDYSDEQHPYPLIRNKTWCQICRSVNCPEEEDLICSSCTMGEIENLENKYGPLFSPYSQKAETYIKSLSTLEDEKRLLSWGREKQSLLVKIYNLATPLISSALGIFRF